MHDVAAAVTVDWARQASEQQVRREGGRGGREGGREGGRTGGMGKR